jgi:hypothetical protein
MDGHQHFEDICCYKTSLHLTMEARDSPKMLVFTQQATHCHIPEGININKTK